MTSIIRRREEQPVVRPVIEPGPLPGDQGPDNEHDQPQTEIGPETAQSAAAPVPNLTNPADGAEAADSGPGPGPGPDPDPDPVPEDDAEPVPPLFAVMAAVPESGATTLAAWCGCAEEIERDTAWRPGKGRSPYLVLTAPKSPDGVRAARQLAGALSHTVGGGAQVTAIVLLEDQPRPTLALRELITAAERAGIAIHTLAHDPRMRLPDEDEHAQLWTPRNAGKPAVPTVLETLYRHLFHHIAADIAEKDNRR
jgi:hypothetical protein